MAGFVLDSRFRGNDKLSDISPSIRNDKLCEGANP